MVGKLTREQIDKLSGTKAAEALTELGKGVMREGLFAAENSIDKVLKSSKTQKKIDDLGNKYTRQEWTEFGADATLADIYEDLESLIRSKVFMFKNLPNFSE